MATEAGDERTPIWLDCDTGHDDAFAILLAAYHPKADLLGISTVHGNASIQHTTHNSLAVLEAIGASHVPVYQGRERPLRREASFAPGIHGESGLDGVTLLPSEPAASPLSDSLTEVANTILEQPPSSVHIIATGPLTNIAILFSWSAELAMHIAGLHIMGGAIGANFTDAPMGKVEGEGERFGNHSPWAEFNIYADPEAARAIFNNKRLAEKTTLIPLDLTHLVRGTAKVQNLLFDSHRKLVHAEQKRKLSVVRSLFREVLNFFASTYKAQFGIEDGPPLHDPLAVWSALEAEQFHDTHVERWDVDVIVEQGPYDPVTDPTNHVGQTTIKQSPTADGVRIPRSLDIDLFWSSINDALQKAEETIGGEGLSIASSHSASPAAGSPNPASSAEEKEKRKASLNTWRKSRLEQLENGQMPPT
ncbi:MAG: hypothetical protein Q9159_004920 [Coniocarpon cinnabarinum]